jgi:hypothetical protein
MQKIAAPTLFLWLNSLLILLSAVTGCVAAQPPYEEYTLARSAVRAAQESDSARFATAMWNKAEDNYRSGQKAYKEAEYENAKKYFSNAVQYAEMAENATRLKKFQTGESFP